MQRSPLTRWTRHKQLVDPVGEVRDFLSKHPMAKIIVVVDTHCLENRSFVWKGDTPMSYQGCLLLEVSLHLLYCFA